MMTESEPEIQIIPVRGYNPYRYRAVRIGDTLYIQHHDGRRDLYAVVFLGKFRFEALELRQTTFGLLHSDMNRQQIQVSRWHGVPSEVPVLPLYEGQYDPPGPQKSIDIKNIIDTIKNALKKENALETTTQGRLAALSAKRAPPSLIAPKPRRTPDTAVEYEYNRRKDLHLYH